MFCLLFSSLDPCLRYFGSTGFDESEQLLLMVLVFAQLIVIFNPGSLEPCKWNALFTELKQFILFNMHLLKCHAMPPGALVEWYFNSLQSECFAECFLSDINMVISAPTGSGKTVLFELCILRLLSRFLSQDGKFNHVKGTLKTAICFLIPKECRKQNHSADVIAAFDVDVWSKPNVPLDGAECPVPVDVFSPSKALVQEKHRDWNQKLGSWGISCLELTGDSEFYNRSNIQDADIILTTPEKFDAVTRYRIKDGGLSFFSDIGLLLIDEVHLLNDQRGASLEAIVSRIKMLARNPEMNSSALARVRFIAVSATIPNVEDLGKFTLASSLVQCSIKLFVYRPAKIPLFVMFSTAEWLLVPNQGIKRFGEEMRPVKLTTKVFGYAPAKNDFLFERRLENYIFADILMQCSRGKSALIFCSTRKGAQEAALRLSQTAITFGHSNPFIKSQEQQERLKEASLSFSDKQMQSCIIFGVGYHNGGLCLKDRNLIEGLFLRGDLQILCTTNTLAHGINLPAHTVVINNKEKGSYIEYDRSMILQNPVNYAVKKNLPSECLEKHMQEICLQKANELQRHGMIWMDEYGFLLKSLEPGRLMTKYYLKFDTMKHIIQTSENCSLEDALHTICRSEEIAWIQLRRNEKKLLNDVNIDKEGRLRFHILNETGKRKKRIQTREEKIFILTNDSLTGDPSCHDLSLTQDMSSICSNGCRISKCMKEYFIHKKNYRGVLNSSLLAKCLHQRLWDDSPYLLKQLSGIGMVTAKALNLAGINSFKTLAEADPRRIEIVTGRKYPFGNHIKESLSSLPPKIEMKMEEIECQRQGKSKLVVTLDRLSQPSSLTKRHCADMVIGSEEDNLILFHEKIRVEEFSSPYCVTVFVSSPQQGKFTVKADLIFEEYIGLDLHEKLYFEKDRDSKLIHKPEKQRSSYSRDLPREIFVIDDDDKSTAPVPLKEPYDSRTSNKESMPSFELLDEDMDEGVPAFETDGKEQETISGKTVFEHIRKKSKDFPRLEALDASDTPVPKTFISPRKRAYGNLTEVLTDIDLSDEFDVRTVQKETVILSDSEPEQQEKQNYDTAAVALDDYNIFRTLGISNATQKDMNEGTEEKGCDNVLTEETIFDHIRKKSKDLPAFSTLCAMECEHTKLEKEPIHEVSHRFQTAIVEESEEKDSMIPRKTGVTQLSESEETEKHVYGTNESAVVNKNALYNRSNRGAELKVSLLNALSGKRDICFSDKGRAALQSKGSVNGSRMQLCTTDAMGETRGVTSFLGNECRPDNQYYDCGDAQSCDENLESWRYLVLDSSTVVDLFEVELDMAEDLFEVSVCTCDAEAIDMEEASGSITLAFRNGGCNGKGTG
ncbi:hypothetical protein Syun_024142 [Stephania yunnanensis]|uniref:Uncharacterized protein n=1 Tax=Stephania yunnanensis TaxID=152371 RepID=A0AAP0FBA1_9MAGN